MFRVLFSSISQGDRRTDTFVDIVCAISCDNIPGGGFNIFYFHPYLGKIPILTNIFQRG